MRVFSVLSAGGDELGRIKEIKRCPLVVGIFPNDAVIIRLVAALLLEQQNKWQIDCRPVFSELSMTKLDSDAESSKGHNRAALSAAA